MRPRMLPRAGSGGSASERVGQLRAEDRDIGIVVTLDQAVALRAAGVLVDVGLLEEQIREAAVDLQVLVELVLRAQRYPEAVLVRQPRRAVRRVDRRLVPCEAAAEHPEVVVVIVRADRDTPGV